MIKKVLITTFIFLLLANFLISCLIHHKIIKGGGAQDQWQKNIILTQDYLYDSEKSKVIVGTSLSQRVYNQKFLGDFDNLCFGGLSTLDALGVVVNSQKSPKVILIEVNEFQKGLDEDFNKNIFNPIFYNLKETFLILREENKPVNFIISVANKAKQVKQKIWHFFDFKKSDKSEKSKEDKTVEKNKEVKEVKKDALSMAIEDENNFNKESISKNIKKLKEYVTEMEKRGAEIIFFELPFHEKICNSLKIRYLRGEIKDNFPNAVYLEMPDCSQYSTGDAKHLDKESARRFSEHLFLELKKRNILY